eukprot:1160343-Pelagomonas_calceolata.AAC.1
MGVWGVTGSTRLQNLAVRSFVIKSTPSRNKFMSILNRMGMQIANAAVRASFKARCPTSTQKDGVKSHYLSINKFAGVCVLLLCRLQLLSRPRVFTVLDLNQVHAPLVYIQLVGLPHAQNSEESVKCAHKFVTTRDAIGNKNIPHSQVLEPDASNALLRRLILNPITKIAGSEMCDLLLPVLWLLFSIFLYFQFLFNLPRAYFKPEASPENYGIILAFLPLFSFGS